MGRPAEAIDPIEFRTMWTEAVGGREMATHFGCSRATISSTASKLGLPPRKSGWAHEDVASSADVSRVLKLHAQGLAVAGIATQLPHGVGIAEVMKVLAEHDLTPNVGTPGRPGYKIADQRSIECANLEMLRTACAVCGDHHVGTLRESREWFKSHRCGEPVAAPVEPAPYANPERELQRVERRAISPRVGSALILA